MVESIIVVGVVFRGGVVGVAMGGRERRRESRGGEGREVEGEEEGENLWSSLLGEVQTSRTSQLPTTKSLLVLGDKESGKTTLIAKLQVNSCLFFVLQFLFLLLLSSLTFAISSAPSTSELSLKHQAEI